MTEICTIPELKILISQTETTIREREVALAQSYDLLRSLQKRLDESVVDVLRLKVRRLIEENHYLYLDMLWSPNQKKDVPCLRRDDGHDPCGKTDWTLLSFLTEEEAIYLVVNKPEFQRKINYSYWNEYRYAGEID